MVLDFFRSLRDTGLLRAVLESTEAGVFALDLDGRCTFVNPAGAGMLGAAPQDVLGSDFHLLAHVSPDGCASHAAEDCPIRGVATSEPGVVTNDDVLWRRDSTSLTAQSTASPILSHDVVTGTVLVLQVISRQQRDALIAVERAAREQAEAATRQRDELLALVSHDLRSPLATIRGRAQLLRRRVAASVDPSKRDYLLDGLQQVESVTDRMTDQIDELLDLAHLEAGQPLDLDRQPTDLVELARQTIAEHQELAQRHHIRFESAAPVASGAWDARRLRRVLDNLLSNAVKYSPSGGVVDVSIELANGCARLQVRDQGVGIPTQDLPRVFERFYRASNAVGQAAGSGIGLAGVRQIVEQHGGSIAVQTGTPRGTTFSVCLPLAPAPTMPVREP